MTDGEGKQDSGSSSSKAARRLTERGIGSGEFTPPPPPPPPIKKSDSEGSTASAGTHGEE